MKNTITRSLAVSLLIGTFALISLAQDRTERVKFASGATDGYWTRDIPANGSHEFVFGAKKGQTIGYTVGYDFKESDVEAFLTEPGLQDIAQSSGPKKPNEFRVNKTGDHRLTVNNTTRKKVTITLYLDISEKKRPAGLDIDPDQIVYNTIKFKRGEIYADVAGSLAGFNEVKWYEVKMSGKDGEMMVVDPEGQPEERGIHIEVKDTLGEVVNPDDTSCNNRVEVPQTKQGNYVIVVTQCDADSEWNGRFKFRVGAGPAKLF